MSERPRWWKREREPWDDWIIFIPDLLAVYITVIWIIVRIVKTIIEHARGISLVYYCALFLKRHIWIACLVILGSGIAPLIALLGFTTTVKCSVSKTLILWTVGIMSLLILGALLIGFVDSIK